jgi:hypothetical protein
MVSSTPYRRNGLETATKMGLVLVMQANAFPSNFAKPSDKMQVESIIPHSRIVAYYRLGFLTI